MRHVKALVKERVSVFMCYASIAYCFLRYALLALVNDAIVREAMSGRGREWFLWYVDHEIFRLEGGGQ